MSDLKSDVRKLSAIMFTDIHGYSRMMQIDEKETIKLLDEHNRLLFPIIEKHGGTIIKTVGDAILAVFDSCISAVESAVLIQEALSQRAVEENAKVLRVRIGIHLGEIVYKDNDVFGNGVNIAARLQPLADPGGICFSQSVFEQISSHYSDKITRVGPVNLKNISEPHVIYRMQIEGFDVNTGTDTLKFNTAFAEGHKKSPAGSSTKTDVTREGYRINSTFASVRKTGVWAIESVIIAKVIFGEMTLDFSMIDLNGRIIEIDVKIICGELKIIHKGSQSILVDVDVAMGDISECNASVDENTGVIKVTGKVIMGAVTINRKDN
ncbi:MAG: hypothetical protein A2015_15270 [Spirochaetes bacterium GWF1_31_7]|nr:MAG: hypothetical protein A2Y30_11695 [Spirochaetes bacterium GWE1_32_154]OHD51181.1 MAG: hypothetical protein A2Y29_01235 [Spirochaetes bacterium GWE2_31_10]OHD52100.1 MAG: hypothetical protein A2015_15270 [Spirochaetes bacterium GWF1_31_7]HBD93274.1 hypothetical protein [Spirochaetia bacterium]